ncbi:MAG: N-6 DNA methylase [Verrucomicrobia bacterium]|nr:N-6 DNA methylase [Verrucomicrobiota bacterium]
MASEQLIQNELLDGKGLKGTPFGKFEKLKLGATTVDHLVKAGLETQVSESISFPFTQYSPPKSPKACKPDNVIIRRVGTATQPVAIEEFKKPAELKTEDGIRKASEQGLFSAAALDVKLAVITDGTKVFYLNVPESLKKQQLVHFEDTRKFSPGVLEELLCEQVTMRDPGELAEKVWQMIWHATKEEPKPCLLTFVEMFVLKFLSDNLPPKIFPKKNSFYELLTDLVDFQETHGCTPIEHYINSIRPAIKQIFPDNTIAKSKSTASVFGLETVISKTSIINGFSFMKNSSSSPATFNRVFVDILKAFNDFGPLTSIDPEFKLRLYETFLKKSAGQQKLGQFFTPRNVVQSIIRMARMHDLPQGAIVLDPACGVGGFVLEPLITEPCLAGNIEFQNGLPHSRIKLIGVDVDANTHILAKANLLIHLVELVRSPTVTPAALNQLMAQTLVLMNANETLGSLEHPPTESVDLIMTNPPYVTQGSRIYKDELKTVKGKRNEVTLSEYYDKTGLGLESLFLRYISGALKPGGRAFVIVPQGMLSRSETSTKETVLGECNLLASIALPSNTFFNTPQKTYIIALEKRHTEHDPRPDVLCAIARSIGETLDCRRVSVSANDLATIANQFVGYSEQLSLVREANGIQCQFSPSEPFVKLVKADQFTKNDRWDSARLWSSDELVDLGVMESAIGRLDFVEEAKSQLPSLLEELEQAKRELAILTTVEAEVISLDNPAFTLRRGRRVKKEECDLNPGDANDPNNYPVPVYSGSNLPNKALGYIGVAWLQPRKIPVENLQEASKGVLTINSNGSVGKVFVRYMPCVIHDDVTVIEIIRPDIDVEYLATQLRSSVAEGNFEYEAKLYAGRIRELVVTIPVGGSGYDLEKQQQIAEAYKRFDVIKGKLEDFGKWAANSRMKNDNQFHIRGCAETGTMED